MSKSLGNTLDPIEVRGTRKQRVLSVVAFFFACDGGGGDAAAAGVAAAAAAPRWLVVGGLHLAVNVGLPW